MFHQPGTEPLAGGRRDRWTAAFGPAQFELIAIRRHAERELPHMSWFHGKRIESETTAEETMKDEK